MAKRPEPPTAQAAVHVGGDAVGSALAAGDNNTQTVAFTAPASPGGDGQAEVLAALRGIRAAFEELSGPRAATAKREADAALAAAAAEAPDKDAVGGALEGALGAALKTAEFGNSVVKLAPHLRTAAQWLGGQWAKLADLVS